MYHHGPTQRLDMADAAATGFGFCHVRSTLYLVVDPFRVVRPPVARWACESEPWIGAVGVYRSDTAANDVWVGLV
jgi:hypothetical protein